MQQSTRRRTDNVVSTPLIAMREISVMLIIIWTRFLKMSGLLKSSLLSKLIEICLGKSEMKNRCKWTKDRREASSLTVHLRHFEP